MRSLAIALLLSGCATTPAPDFTKLRQSNVELSSATTRALADGKSVRTHLRDYSHLSRIDYKAMRLLEGVE